MDARRLVLRGTPVAFGVVSLLHPVPGTRPIVEALEPSLRRWLLVHIVQLALLALLAATLWLLVGLARGLDGEARATAVRLAQAFWDARLTQGTAIFAVIAAAHLAWLVAVGAAAVALRQTGASRAVAGLVALAGVLFAIGHAWPTGTAAMACLGAATSLRTRRSA